MTTGRNVLGRDRSPSGPSGSPNVPSDPTRPPGSHFDNGALGESALPRSSGGNDLGRDRSPSGPSGETALPKRKHLSHQVPPWVAEGATFFITVNCLPRGVNQLAFPVTAAGLAESVFVRAERGNWWSKLLLFMPDHVHALMVFAPERLMLRVISDWKRYTARHLGIRWQRDFFDHRIRNEESLAEKWDYIVHNPVRAGLVGRPEQWPYVWFGDDIGRDRSPSRSKASPSDPPDSGDLGRDGSPSRPPASPSRPMGRPPTSHPDIGALGESALPRTPYPDSPYPGRHDEA